MSEVKLADRIRRFVLENYIQPARAAGQRSVMVRVGDVNTAMGLNSRQAAIAGAVGAKKFEQYAHVRLLSREGPHMGANLIFTFEIL